MTICKELLSMTNAQLACLGQASPSQTRMQLLLQASSKLSSRPAFSCRLASLLWQFGEPETLARQLEHYGWLLLEVNRIKAELRLAAANEQLLMTLAEASATAEQAGPASLQGKLIVFTAKEAKLKQHLDFYAKYANA